MPTKGSEDKTKKTAGGKVYISETKAMKEYTNSTVKQIKVCIPREWDEPLREYIKSPTNRYGSVNGLICALLANELGMDYTPIPPEKQKNKKYYSD